MLELKTISHRLLVPLTVPLSIQARVDGSLPQQQ